MWMGDSKLNMNDDETELIAIGTKSKIGQVTPTLLLCASLAMVYRFLGLLEILMSV